MTHEEYRGCGLAKVLKEGVSIRQASRLTGISIGVISKFINGSKMTENRPLFTSHEMASGSAEIFSQEWMTAFYPLYSRELFINTANDWNTSLCSRAAVLTIDKSVLESLAVPIAAASGYELTEKAAVYLIRNSYASVLTNLVNGMGSDPDWITASTLMTIRDVHVLAGYPAEYAYILLDSGREDGLAALVSVLIKEDGAASIISSFIKAPQFLDTVFSLEGQDLVTVLSKMLTDEGIFLPLVDTTIPEGIHFAVYRFSL